MSISPITLTEAAKNALGRATTANELAGFAIRIKLAGKDGKALDLSFEEYPREDDVVFRTGGFVFHLKQEVVDRLRGVTIDHGDRGFTFRAPPTTQGR